MRKRRDTGRRGRGRGEERKGIELSGHSWNRKKEKRIVLIKWTDIG